MGTNNKINNARCVIEALRSLRVANKVTKNSKEEKTEVKVEKTKK